MKAATTWGGACMRNHVNEAGESLRYVKNGACVMCQRWHSSQKYAKNGERARQYQRERRQANLSDPEWVERQRELSRASYRRVGRFRGVRYNLSKAEVEQMYAEQANKCAACGSEEPPDPTSGQVLRIDHDHACCPGKTRSCGKCVRGLLCNRCNIVAGAMENPVTPLVVAYLEAWR